MKQQERRKIATKDVWQKGLDTLRATRRQTMIVAAIGLVAPQLILGLAFDTASAPTVAALRGMFADTAASPGVSYAQLVGPAMSFVARFAVTTVVIAMLAMASYFALVQIVVRHHRGEPLPRPVEALAYGIKLTLTRGIWLAIVLGSLIFLGQFLVAPAILVAILSLALPVLLVADGGGGWRALGDALSLRYVRGTAFSPWNVLFTLLTLAAFLYTAVALTSMAVDFMLHADEALGVPRTLWVQSFPGLPFGPVYLLAAIIEAAALTTAVTLMPALTAALYFIIVPPLRIDATEFGTTVPSPG
jgi:hypothetical protein